MKTHDFTAANSVHISLAMLRQSRPSSARRLFLWIDENGDPAWTIALIASTPAALILGWCGLQLSRIIWGE